MPIGPKRLPLLQHLDELRKRLAIIAFVVFVGSMALYFYADQIYDIIMSPILDVLGEDGAYVFGPFEGFGLRFKVSLYATLILGSPIILWQILAFFLPALKPKEQRYVIPTFFAAVALFAAGVAFCYTTVLGTAFEWMLGQTWDTVGQIADASKFFSGGTLLMLGFGIGFELPIVVFYLVLFNIVPYAKLRENWRVAYVSLMVVASIATPDWSPVTMGALFAALVALYEASLLLARILLAKRIAEQKRLAS